jgi:hypothetical protein
VRCGSNKHWVSGCKLKPLRDRTGSASSASSVSPGRKAMRVNTVSMGPAMAGKSNAVSRTKVRGPFYKGNSNSSGNESNSNDSLDSEA